MSNEIDREDELLQGCDEEGLAGQAVRRGEAHGGSFAPHLAVHIIVERPDGRLLLQKRSTKKRIQPGRWDTSVGGHVNAREDVASAARRELEEELGITGIEPERIYQYLWRSKVECEFVNTFLIRWSGPANYPKEEIEEVRDWTVEDIRSAPEDIFTPNFLYELERFFEWRESH